MLMPIHSRVRFQMNTKRICLLSFLAVTMFVGGGLSQSHGEKDTLYERLKKTNINKMTDREYQYFMLMKKAETGGENKDVPKKGTVTGVVTYYFNDNYGEKADVGAKVFILPKKYEKKVSEVRECVIELLKRELAALRSREVEALMSASDFYKLVDAVKKFISDLESGNIKGITRVIADGSGSFSATLPPGDYSLIAKSAHRTKNNDLEIFGMVDFNDATVRAGETVSIKVLFE